MVAVAGDGVATDGERTLADSCPLKERKRWNDDKHTLFLYLTLMTSQICSFLTLLFDIFNTF